MRSNEQRLFITNCLPWLSSVKTEESGYSALPSSSQEESLEPASPDLDQFYMVYYDYSAQVKATNYSSDQPITIQ